MHMVAVALQVGDYVNIEQVLITNLTLVWNDSNMRTIHHIGKCEAGPY